jgi:transcription antitermination protein NusB
MQNQRRGARQSAMQAIYQWQMTRQDVAQIEQQFLAEQDTSRFDLEYFQELLHGVPSHLHELDGLLAPLLDRSIERVDPVERAILRLGAYELTHRPEMPFRVVINEGVELAKRFGATEGHRYINGVLDRLARQVRATEIENRRPPTA